MASRDPIERACMLHDEAGELRAAGKAKEALRAAKQAVALFEKHDGPKSPDVANALTELSGAAHDLGDYDVALTSAERAWTILKPLVDKGNVALDQLKLTAIGALGQAHIARGEYERAGKVHVLALPIAKRLGGPELAGVLNNLGMVCKYTGRYAEGRRHYLKGLAILEKKFGRNSIALTAILHNLGGLEHSRGRFADGIPWARRGLAIRERLLGKKHHHVASDAAALAALLDGNGERREARKLYKQALGIYEHVHGPRHFEVGFNLANLAALEHGDGQLAKADALYTKALEIEKEVLGDGHPYVALTLHNLGLLRVEQGRAKEGRKLLEVSVATYRRALGPSHPDTKGAAAILAKVRKSVASPRA